MPPCHSVSQSFALPPATKPVSHLPCPLPLHHCVTASPHQSDICLAPCHQTSQSFALPSTTASPYHCITRISQTFALPPATKPITHLPCPLPPNQSVICLALYHCITVSPHHPHQSDICLAPCHQTSQSFALPSTTVSPCHCITRISQTFTLPPATNASLHQRITASPHLSVICLAPCHQTSQSFDLPSTTPRHCITASPGSPHHHINVSPHHHVNASLHHCVTMSVSHLPCPLPPNQSVIGLAPCHQISQLFDLPSTTASLCHLITASPCHCIIAALCHRVTALVSYLPCPLPPNQSVI